MLRTIRTTTFLALASIVFLPLIFTDYKFNMGAVLSCDPNAGITYVNGFTNLNGLPVNGVYVVFSSKPDGPIIAAIQSGPHSGYPQWNPGFWSHILLANGPRQGEWYFWTVDEHSKRSSIIVHLHTDGLVNAHSCQQGLILFDHQ